MTKESSSSRLYQKSREKYNFKKMSKKIQNYQRNIKMSRQTIHTSNFVAGISKRVLIRHTHEQGTIHFHFWGGILLK